MCLDSWSNQDQAAALSTGSWSRLIGRLKAAGVAQFCSIRSFYAEPFLELFQCFLNVSRLEKLQVSDESAELSLAHMSKCLSLSAVEKRLQSNFSTGYTGAAHHLFQCIFYWITFDLVCVFIYFCAHAHSGIQSHCCWDRCLRSLASHWLSTPDPLSMLQKLLILTSVKE